MAVAYGKHQIKHDGPFVTVFTLDKVNLLLKMEYDDGKHPIRVLNKLGFEASSENTHHFRTFDYFIRLTYKASKAKLLHIRTLRILCPHKNLTLLYPHTFVLTLHQLG